MSRYMFLPGSPFHGDADEVQEELEHIRAREALTPEAVVVVAKSKRSVLHPYIYDGTSADDALDKYRLGRARMLLRAIVIVRDEIPSTIRANIRVVAEEGRAWESVDLPEVRQVEMARLRRELRSLRDRLRDLEMYPSVVLAIEEVLAA